MGPWWPLWLDSSGTLSHNEWDSDWWDNAKSWCSMATYGLSSTKQFKWKAPKFISLSWKLSSPHYRVKTEHTVRNIPMNRTLLCLLLFSSCWFYPQTICIFPENWESSWWKLRSGTTGRHRNNRWCQWRKSWHHDNYCFQRFNVTPHRIHILLSCGYICHVMMMMVILMMMMMMMMMMTMMMTMMMIMIKVIPCKCHGVQIPGNPNVCSTCSGSRRK